MRTAFTLALMLSFFSVNAQLELAKIFANHAVLQREKPLPIWGTARPKTKVTVQLNQQTATATTDAGGKWKLVLPPMPAGGPYTLTARADKDTVTYRDVYLGEVWFCSGQSNMEWPFSLTDDAVADSRRAKDTKIRHLKIGTDLSLTPREDLLGPRQDWLVNSPLNVAQFTAVGYYFAKQLREQLGEDIAIGLINCTWGGSQIEGWLSKEGMAQTNALKDYAANFPTQWEASDKNLEARVLRYCFGNKGLPADIAEQEQRYSTPDYDFGHWPKGYMPLSWDWLGCWAYRGKGYMARTIDVPEFLLDSNATVYLAQTDHILQVWFNGTALPLLYEGNTAKVNVPAALLKAGKNRLVLHVAPQKQPEWAGVGIYGNPKDLRMVWSDFTIALDDNEWHIMPEWGSGDHRFEHLQNNEGAIIYNGMVHPVAPYAVRGFLWYQGESNAVRAHQYRETFPALIADWRRVWGETLPFLFVQLSAFGGNQNANQGSVWAELREAQTLTLNVPQTAMAVTLDIGNAADIHPRNKKEVGRRLALAALNMVYKKPISFQSPKFTEIAYQGPQAVLTFEQVGSGLVAKDKYGYVRGFEVAGEDRQFHYATAQITANNQIKVVHPQGKNIVAVRYAWSDAPTDVNVYNGDGLPLGTFRTDNWKGLTDEARF